MKINSNIKQNSINFKGYARWSEGKYGNNHLDCCISESHLMRNLETTMFAKNYAIDNFPNGTNIAVPGCSQLECYTWGALLNKENYDKKYKILGFDIVPEVIEDAKLGVLNIGYDSEARQTRSGVNYIAKIPDRYEHFLINNHHKPTSEQIEAKKAFYDCFVKIPEKWKTFNIHHPGYKRKVKRVTGKNQDIETTRKRLEYILLPNKRFINAGEDFIPKEGIFKDIIDFKVSDIFNIDKELAPKSTGILSFKNGLYHILEAKNTDINNINTNTTKQLFKKINSVLSDEGLFVLGTLHKDHLCNPSKLINKCKEKGQDKFIVSNSKIHTLLKKSGFEPIFYDFSAMFENKAKNLVGIYLPSVWKKVKHL